ncbi:hypothetical protein SDC9_176838 [bioreactor metagenome]|uniref:Uncharacterized protein n=1 Tax=bioreactor metagenome TaxID=1076179 RepID=A0A645GRM0_9ZZZZ
MQRWAGIAAGIDILDDRHFRVQRPVNAGRRHAARQPPENAQAEQAHHRHPQAEQQHGADILHAGDRQRGIDPERGVERKSQRGDRYRRVQPGQRHHGDRIQRIAQDGEIGPEEDHHERRRTQCLERPQGIHPGGDLAIPGQFAKQVHR